MQGRLVMGARTVNRALGLGSLFGFKKPIPNMSTFDFKFSKNSDLFELTKLVGKGKYSKVYEGTSLMDEKKVIVKILNHGSLIRQLRVHKKRSDGFVDDLWVE